MEFVGVLVVLVLALVALYGGLAALVFAAPLAVTVESVGGKRED